MPSRPISKPSASWMQDFGTPNEGLIEAYFNERLKHLDRNPTVPARAEIGTDPKAAIESLVPHYTEIAKVMEFTANQALNKNAEEYGEMPTRRMVRERLLDAQKELPKKLQEAIPSLSAKQVALVQDMFSAWRIRVLSYTAHLDRDAARTR